VTGLIPSLPSLSTAVQDGQLSAVDLKVLLALAMELHPTEWRPVKEAALRRAVHLGRTRLYQALRVLVTRGYLERQIGGPGHVSQYRLCYSVRVGERTDAA
jgi:predicted transcriptional regulator